MRACVCAYVRVCVCVCVCTLSIFIVSKGSSRLESQPLEQVWFLPETDHRIIVGCSCGKQLSESKPFFFFAARNTGESTQGGKKKRQVRIKI